jgi:fatty acid desaturase
LIPGILLLALAKILDNMEIGHNVMHGQYDWMNDPTINSRNFEWDIAGDANSWKRIHNYEHHTFTNIIGKDRDFGYGLLRLSDDLPWRRKNLWQIITYLNLSFLFEWGIAYHELAAERVFLGKKRQDRVSPLNDQQLKRMFFNKIAKQVFKDYIFFPILCWPVFFPVLIGNVAANLIRNIWTSTIIFCGHFTEGVHTFSVQECQNESKGHWYYRQILGSSNLTGKRWFHILTGHLSCQIEHHLFPDIPAHRYVEMAPKVQAILRKYAIAYNTGSFWKQYTTVVKRVLRYSFPNKTQTIST